MVPSALTRIEVETDDRENGLPCRVVYRPDADTKTILWSARFERGFCHRKAEETRLVLHAKGWACEPAVSEGALIHRNEVVAAWHCEKASETTGISNQDWPPRPSTRPQDGPGAIGRLTNPTLRSAVERDLVAMGNAVAGQSTLSATADGDLNKDGLQDAVVVLSHQNDRRGRQRLVMAYLGDGKAYHLVDVKITLIKEQEAVGNVAVEIDDGVIELTTCCDVESESIVLALRDRKLAYGK